MEGCLKRILAEDELVAMLNEEATKAVELLYNAKEYSAMDLW